MDETSIVVKKRVKLNKPVLVVGLPGIGNVGRLIASNLRREFETELIATLYSRHFPHNVVMTKSGGIRLVGNRFYLLKGSGSKRDIVLLTGETQAATNEGQYEINSRIVDFFKNELNGSFVYTLGGYAAAKPEGGEPRVFGNVTRKDVIKKFDGSGVIFGKSRGVIFGSAGMVLAFAKMAGMDGVCLMGETRILDLDAAAAKSVLKVLAAHLGMKIDTQHLDSLIEKTARHLKNVEKSMPQGQMPGAFDFAEKPSYIR